LDEQAEEQQSNAKLLESLEAYQAVLLLYGDILNDALFRKTATRYIERARFIGKPAKAVKVQEKLIERFPEEPQIRNQLAVTFLLMNR